MPRGSHSVSGIVGWHALSPPMIVVTAPPSSGMFRSALLPVSETMRSPLLSAMRCVGARNSAACGAPSVSPGPPEPASVDAHPAPEHGDVAFVHGAMQTPTTHSRAAGHAWAASHRLPVASYGGTLQ